MKVIINGVEYAPVAALQTHIQGEFVTGTAQAKQAKPKPLLSDAKVGDLARNKFGWFQIADTEFDKRFPIYSEKCGCFTLNGKASEAQDCGIDILEWQPLATEGSAEWAWQMMLLGNKVTDMNTVYWRCDNFVTWKNPEAIGNIVQTPNCWIAEKASTGWQLYEPKPKPCPTCNGTGVVMHKTANAATQTPLPISDATQIKVGDWVTDGVFQGKIASFGNGTAWVVSQGSGYHINIENLRKLKPSEVRVKVVLEGTVRSSINDCCFDMSTPNGGWATIGYNEIDPATADLVRDLIAKQEDNNG